MNPEDLVLTEEELSQIQDILADPARRSALLSFIEIEIAKATLAAHESDT
jgi:hypothetical protein